ncbi:unnamed protein product, partial [Brenthis ino]
MVVYTPVILLGSNLKDRHRNLNDLVHQAFEENLCVQDVINLPENSPIDRIFKIDLASKSRLVDFILQNLKDDNMLYVSRCLKCLWLLEPQYSNIINPSHLESYVYPEMTLPAVNKMKNWLHLNLKDTERNCEFYNYYKNNFEYAVKFFWHCSNEFILSEFSSIVDKLSHKHIKRIFESCPKACQLYFEILPKNKLALTRYVENECDYFKNVKCLLKWDTDMYLNLIEKYFNKDRSEPFNSTTTQYVLKNCKDRIFAKIELYASCILHMNTLAATLKSEDAKQLVQKLARASYLKHWFTYKAVEPLIKRVRVEERAKFKKQIFVDKSIDQRIEEWPYEIPVPFKLEVEEKNEFLLDVENGWYSYRGLAKCDVMLASRNFYSQCKILPMGKSPLDLLFDRYRFMGFEQTYNELKLKLLTESSIPGRLNIMLVLVSKSGGVSDHVEKLLSFLVQRHLNEPTTLRAAVIRSFVNRQCIWRLPENSWNLLLDFGRNLGLDGLIAEHFCREGLHAVIIRYLLACAPVPPNVLTGFLREDSLLTEYKLSKSEKSLIAKQLPPLFLPSNPDAFIRALKEYNVSIDDFPEAKPVLVKLAREDSNLVRSLYHSKILRRELFCEIFTTEQSEAAYMNVLRHDISPLEQGKAFVSLVQEKKRLKFDNFLQSLSLYFTEPGGLAEMHKHALDEQLKNEPKSIVARSLCILSSDKWLLSRLSELDSQGDDKTKNKVNKQLAAAFRANAHKTKPPPKIDELNWRWLGAKAVANKIFIFRARDRQKYLKKLLDWRRTARISIRLAYGTDHDVDTFLQACSIRPVAALKVALSTYLRQKDVDLRIWTAVKSIMENEDLSKNTRLFIKLNNLVSLPKSIESDYHIVMFKTYLKHDIHMVHLKYLKNHLPEVEKSFIYGVVADFINKRLNPLDCLENKGDYEYNYVSIIAKCLLLCESEEQQKYVLDIVCDPFFDAVQSLSPTKTENDLICKYLYEFIFCLKYTKAFLGQEYINLLPVFERIMKKLHKILPTQEYFAKYVEIHLTMLYYKTIKQVLQIRPDVFEDPKKTKECVQIVGKLFGKYIGFEIKELVSKYFRSIVSLYADVLQKYLQEYFVLYRGNNRGLFVACVIKGLLEVNSTDATIIALNLFKQSYQFIEKSYHDEILKIFLEWNNDEVKFLLCTDVFPMFYSNYN